MQIIFDFDGVIFNSHKIKTNAFYEVFKSYGKKNAIKAKRFHENNIGKSRYFKFKFILKNFLKKKITKKEILKLDENFDLFVKKKMNKMKPPKNLLKFLKSEKKNHNFYISTGTPQNKIIKILKEKKLFFFFKKIYGSPRSKVDHINEIKKKYKDILFVGDSFEDYKASVDTKIDFILKINSENVSLRKKNKTKNIQSFKFLKKYI